MTKRTKPVEVTPRQRQLADYHAQLAREFLARKCLVCGERATVICVMPGQAPLESDRNYCLRCMIAADKAVDRADA